MCRGTLADEQPREEHTVTSSSSSSASVYDIHLSFLITDGNHNNTAATRSVRCVGTEGHLNGLSAASWDSALAVESISYFGGHVLSKRSGKRQKEADTRTCLCLKTVFCACAHLKLLVW